MYLFEYNKCTGVVAIGLAEPSEFEARVDESQRVPLARELGVQTSNYWYINECRKSIT